MINRDFIFFRTLLLNTIFYGSVGFLPWLSPYVIQENKIDQIIGFHPYSIYLYISFFILIWHTIKKIKTKNVKEISYLIPISAFIASIFYLFFPTTIMNNLSQINLSHVDYFTDVLYKMVSKNDTHMNCLPSLHGAITVICLYYLMKEDISLKYKTIYLIWGILICWSAIAIRQHLSLDIITGMLYGGILILSKNYYLKSKNSCTKNLK